MNVIKENFKVGDIIVQKNVFCSNNLTIDRVTKTQAITNNNVKFKISYEVITDDEGNIVLYHIYRIPTEKYDLNKYNVIKSK